MKHAIAALALLATCTTPLAARQERSIAPLLGCYRAGAQELLLTWDPEGGIAAADLDAARVIRLEPAEVAEAGRWRQADPPAEGAVEVRFAGDGAPGTLYWRKPEGDEEAIAFSHIDCGYRQEEVTFTSGTVELAALLLLPDDAGPRPGVVVIHGSGDSNRVGAAYLRTADHLASSGIAVLLPDKRGVGRSGGDWRQASLQELAADAAAGVRALAARRAVAADQVGVLGVSQGGWVAPAAASTVPAIDFVAVLSGAAVPFGEQQRHLLVNLARRMQLTDVARDELLTLSRLGERYLLEGEGWQAYAEARERALGGPLAPIAESLPGSPTTWEWAWGRSFWSFDTEAAWKETTVPVLLVFGAEDEADSIPIRASLDLLRQTIPPQREAPFEAHVFPGMGHALSEPGERAISSKVLRLLSTWIDEHTVREDHAHSFACGTAGRENR